MSSALSESRIAFHRNLLAELLVRSSSGVLTNADKDSKVSCALASSIAEQLGGAKLGQRLKGQIAGKRFEQITHSFIKKALPLFYHLRPGQWEIEVVSRRSGTVTIARFEQYQHLQDLADAARRDPQLAVTLGADYVIAPDLVLFRRPLSVDMVNDGRNLVDSDTARRATLRGTVPILHASISCKWTIRSDRSQNARSEALNLIRNRKGRTPHIVVVTGEPLPSRIMSIATGTGDIDCVYHFALPELIRAAEAVADEENRSTVDLLVQGRRLKDIADLPLDLLV